MFNTWGLETNLSVNWDASAPMNQSDAIRAVSQSEARADTGSWCILEMRSVLTCVPSQLLDLKSAECTLVSVCVCVCVLYCLAGWLGSDQLKLLGDQYSAESHSCALTINAWAAISVHTDRAHTHTHFHLPLYFFTSLYIHSSVLGRQEEKAVAVFSPPL